MTERIELRDFIRDHYPLIATIGVFGALTALFVRIEGFEFIAFIPLMIFFVLMWELIDSFPEMQIPLKGASRRLAVFFVLMMILLIGIAWFIFVEYVISYYQIISFSLFICLSIYTAIAIEGRMALAERIGKRIGGKQYKFLKIISMLLLVLIAMLIANFLTSSIITIINPQQTT
jgi:hypothetical protein